MLACSSAPRLVRPPPPHILAGPAALDELARIECTGRRFGGRMRKRGPASGSKGIASPLALSGCTLWLDATDNAQITNAAGKASQWRDKSATAAIFAQGTASAQPVINASGINGKQTLDFLNTNSVQMTTATLLSALISAGAYTAFAVANYTGAVATVGSSFANTCIFADNPGFWGMYCSTTLAIGFSWDGADKSVRPPQTGGTPFMFAHQLSGGTLRGQVGLAAPTTLGTVGNVTSLGNQVSVGKGAGLFMTGPIGEIVVYNRALSAGEISQVQAYLSGRWGT